MRGWVVTVFSVINFLLYLVVIGLWISIPEETLLNLFSTLAALAITMGLIIANRKTFKTYYQSLYFKKLVSGIVSAFLIFTILGFVNYLAYKNPKVWDVTKGKRNSLTDQTVNLLHSVEGDLEVRIFSLKRDYELVRTLVELYRLQKNDIKISFVDAELEPQLVREAGITKVPAIEVSKGVKKKVIDELSELSLTNAIVKVTRGMDPTLYFVTGHGEMDLSSEANEGGAQLAALLRGNTFQIRTLNLRQSNNIPSDASAIIIWGPKEAFFPVEIKTIEEYLRKGGKVMVALDPDLNSDGQTELMGLMKRYGLTMNNNLVIDRIKNANGSNGTVPVIHKFDANHPITKDFKGTVFLPLVSSLEIISDSEESRYWKMLAVSNLFPAAWAETSKNEIVNMKMTFTEGEDIKGPVGYIAAYDDEKSKIIAFGNSTFVINTYRKFPQNFMMFLNSINWVAGEERLISFNSPVIEDRPVFMSQNQVGLIFYFTIIFCPLVLIIVAFVLYKRRQKL